MADVDPKTIKTVFAFLAELEKGGALFDAWKVNKRAALDSTGLGDLKEMILSADRENNLKAIRERVQREQGAMVCLYVK